MFELGHASPDMAATYVNKRMDLKKKALVEKGGGKFYTIEGRVDAAIGELLLRKEGMAATRVCGGACTLPGQLGEWCEHANACLTCTFFRADGKDIGHFEQERSSLLTLIKKQGDEVRDLAENGQSRMAEIVRRRQSRNKDAACNTALIIGSIQADGLYQGSVSQFRAAARSEEKLHD